jgi:hypothetical protein
MTRIAEIDPREITITPVFKIIELENVPKSETAGYAVMETHEVVEVRFAGSKNYAPTFPANAMYRREGNTVITYAERWPEQYRAFKEGNPQEANGTPLDMLRNFGATPEHISLCRALKIYSIEALFYLEGDRLKSLGMSGNALKAAATKFMAQRDSAAGAFSEIEALKAEIAALRAAGVTVVPEKEATPEEVEAALEAADAIIVGMNEGDAKKALKDELEKTTGARPQGNPSLDTLKGLVNMAKAA